MWLSHLCGCHVFVVLAFVWLSCLCKESFEQSEFNIFHPSTDSGQNQQEYNRNRQRLSSFWVYLTLLFQTNIGIGELTKRV